MDMVGPVYADVFQLSRFLLNKVEVRLKLFQSKHAFRLMTGEKTTKYKVVITDVLLKAAMVGISTDLLRTHARALQSKPAIYPLTKTDMKTFAVAKGQYNVNLDDIFQGRIWDRVLLGMTSSSAYAGHLEKNAFNFEHFNFEFMCQSVPAKALQPKFSSSNYMDAYQTLFCGTGIAGKDAGLLKKNIQLVLSSSKTIYFFTSIKVTSNTRGSLLPTLSFCSKNNLSCWYFINFIISHSFMAFLLSHEMTLSTRTGGRPHTRLRVGTPLFYRRCTHRRCTHSPFELYFSRVYI